MWEWREGFVSWESRESAICAGAEEEPGCPGPVPGGHIQPTPLAGRGEITGEGSKQPIWPSPLLAYSFSNYCLQPKGDLIMDLKLEKKIFCSFKSLHAIAHVSINFYLYL